MVLSKCMAEVIMFQFRSNSNKTRWTLKMHFSVECINDFCLESLAFHNLSACDGRFPQPIELLTLRTMVGGLEMTNEELERYIDEILGENDELKEERDELKTENQRLKKQIQKLKDQNKKLTSRINKRPKQTQVSFMCDFCSIQLQYSNCLLNS